ncbi:hypothetical protein CONCODRAFT_139999 [Conidiobolus coronatus NRRL 28638]|uniref:Uncharacterized protein n=1 Tax=Conidiobolus coronatus (strain ATCC 28846 / CBS 209.66 / NRRL 28638) TaxID=796925 RepID=A0A137PAP2_CONC2|nr:hypothetical protein CONCODRAFT_139999 [Conidiobolus coronatus NRRL 28638]|eukprot:KXN72083.1 hypothetical protein CONCODRAFT_139999 [Conidiobolus coronatus NRRL 28638]
MNSAQRDIFIKFYHDLIKDAFQDLYKASQRGINNSGLESQIRKFNFLEVCIHFANYHWSLDEKWRDMVLVQAVMESITPQNVIHEIVTNLIGFKDAKKWSAFSQTLETFTEWLRLIYNQSKFPLDDYPVLKELANQVLHHLCHDYANLHIVSQLYSNEIPSILNSKIIKLTFYFNQSVKRMVSDRETVFVQKKRIHRVKRNKKAGKEQRTPSPHRIARGSLYDDSEQALNSKSSQNGQQPGNLVDQDGPGNSDIENDSNEEGDFVEGVFDFKKYIGTFANESVVNAHINYLSHILDDTDNSLVEFKLQYVSKMLHSIGVEADYAPLLLKVSYLQIYGKSLDLLSKWELGHFNGTIPRWLKELVKLIEYLISKLVSELQKNPWLFAELLMSKVNIISELKKLNQKEQERERQVIWVTTTLEIAGLISTKMSKIQTLIGYLKILSKMLKIMKVLSLQIIVDHLRPTLLAESLLTS